MISGAYSVATRPHSLARALRLFGPWRDPRMGLLLMIHWGSLKKGVCIMKTLKALGILLVPAAFGFLVASCGSGGGSNRGIPNGRLNFQIGEFTIQNPQNGENDVCLQPDIEIIVPYNSGLCRANAQLEDWIAVRPLDDETKVPLLSTVTFRQSGSSRTCIVETRPAESLIPGTPYYISVDKEGGGSFVFRPGSAAEFTTTSEQGNGNCRNAFKITDTDWDDSQVLDFLQYNRESGDITWDGQDGLNVIIDIFASLGINLLFEPIPDQTIRINFNSAVDTIGLSSSIRVYELDPINPERIEEGFHAFHRYTGLNDCSGDPDAGPNGACIYVNPSKQREVIVTHPSPGWPSGFFMMFVTDKLRSKNGKVLTHTYYQILR